jgi:hypothetical protein
MQQAKAYILAILIVGTVLVGWIGAAEETPVKQAVFFVQ